MRADNVNVFYDQTQALYDVSIDIAEQQITALIGPSGCGKSTFLRCLNRMNDVIDTCSITGQITLNGDDIYAPNVDVVSLRRKVGMGKADPVGCPARAVPPPAGQHGRRGARQCRPER